MNNITVIILAGGRSKRFWPLDEKNLLEFTDTNLLSYHLKTLKNTGIKDFLVVCNPQCAAYLRASRDKFKGLTIHRILQDEKHQGIGQAVLLCREILTQQYSRSSIYIVNCDDLYESNLHTRIINTHFLVNSPLTLSAYKINKYMPLGYFTLKDHKITGIIEKPLPHSVPSDLVNMSLHLFRDIKTLTSSLEAEQNIRDVNDDLYERALNRIINKEGVNFITYTGPWKTLKYPWEVLDIMSYFLSNLKQRVSSSAKIDKKAIIQGPVIIEDGVRIMEYAKIVGPAVIKKNSIIGTGALVRESIIGSGSVVGFHSEITRSYISPNCWFHTNFIGDSVIGNEVNFGAGSILANLRFDGDKINSLVFGKPVNTYRNKLGAIIGSNAQIGVNSVVMPGVKIGKKSLVGPAVLLTKDLQDDSKVILKQELIKSKADLPDQKQIKAQFKSQLK